MPVVNGVQALQQIKKTVPGTARDHAYYFGDNENILTPFTGVAVPAEKNFDQIIPSVKDVLLNGSPWRNSNKPKSAVAVSTPGSKRRRRAAAFCKETNSATARKGTAIKWLPMKWIFPSKPYAPH